MPGNISVVGENVGLLSTVERGIPREPGTQYPMIVPPEGGPPVPYQRVSVVAEAVETQRWLLDWYVGMAIKGMAASPDLCQMAAVLPDWNSEEMGPIREAAHDRAGGNAKANWGNA